MQKPLDPMSVEKVQTPSASYVLRRRYGPARHIIAAASWLTVFTLLFQPVAAWAATQTWNVQMTGGPHDWNTAAHWNAGAGPVPVAGDTASGNQNYTGALTINISANSSLNTLSIGDSITTTLGGTDFVNVSLGSTGGFSLKLENAGPVAAAGTITSQGGANSIGNTLIMSAAAAATGLTINGNSGTLTVSGDIQGAGNVIIGGNNSATFPTGYTVTRLAPIVADMNPGIVVFQNAKTFTGTLTINANATLRVNSVAAMGSGAGQFITVTGALADGFGMTGAELGKIATASAGALAITGNSSTSYDFGTPGLNSLKLGSTVLGDAGSGGATYNGTLTPGTGGYLLGGGGIATKLILANGVLNAAVNATVSGSGIVQLGNTGGSFAGAIDATGGTAYVPNGTDLTGATALTTTGTTPTAGGAVLLGPSGWANGPVSVTLNNGAIGWDANKTITTLPGVYSATTVAGTAGVTPVRLLNLGGTHSVGTMSQDGSYALQNDGAQAVELVKSGVNSTLDVTSAPGGGNTFSGGVQVAGGILLFNNLNQLGNGNIAGNNTGILKLAAGAGAVSTSRILDPLDGGGGGGGGSPLPGFAINVTGTDTLTFTGDFEKSSTGRHGIVKTGTGIVEIVPAALVSAGNTTTTWSIGVRGGTLRLNQLPYRNDPNGGATGVLEFGATGTVDLLAPPAVVTGLANFNTSYGFQQIGVYNGATGTINVSANTILKNSGRTNAGTTIIPAGSALIVAGAGYVNGSELKWGRSTSGGVLSTTNNGGTWDLRSIAFSFFGTAADAAMPSQTDFTLKLNDAKVDGWISAAAFSHNGNLVINDLAGAALSQMDRFTVTNTGNTSWRGTLEKIGTGTVTFTRSGGSATVDSAGAALKISAGTVSAGGTADPFWDTTNGRGVTVENNGTFSITTTSKHIGALTGTGGTTVATGLTLTVDFNTDSASYSGVVSGDGSITKAGSGTWTVSNANTYTGTTTVNAGTLLVNGTLDTQTSAVTVNGTSTLGGAGTINRPVDVQSGATLRPGGSIGTLTVGADISHEAGSIFAWEAKGYTIEADIGTAGTDYSQVVMTSGKFAITGGTLGKLYFPSSVNFSGTFWDSNRTWDIITGGSSSSLGSIADADISVYVDGSLYDGGDRTIAGQGAFSIAYVADGILRLTWTTEYYQWKKLHFTAEELEDPSVSGDDADPDGDRMTNLQEFLAGTDPRDGDSCLVVSGVETRADGVVVSWSSETARFYRIEMATNLVVGFDHTVKTNIAAVPPVNVYTDSPPAEAESRFYRVRLE